jgi:hypothetical protein
MRYYLMDLERTVTTGTAHYWNPLKRGYTDDAELAGKYTKTEANAIVKADVNRRTVAIEETVIDKLLYLEVE